MSIEKLEETFFEYRKLHIIYSLNTKSFFNFPKFFPSWNVKLLKKLVGEKIYWKYTLNKIDFCYFVNMFCENYENNKIILPTNLSEIFNVHQLIFIVVL